MNRAKRAVAAVGFGLAACAIVVVTGLLVSGSNGVKGAVAAPGSGALALFGQPPALGASVAGGVAVRRGSTSLPRLTLPLPAGEMDPVDLVMTAVSPPRVVQSFPMFPAGFVTSQTRVPGDVTLPAAHSLSTAPLMLFGGGWAFAGLTGTFEDPAIQSPGSTPAINPPATTVTAGLQTVRGNSGSNPPGISPPGINAPVNSPPGVNPPRISPPANSPQVSNPQGSNPRGNNPQGNNPQGNNPHGNNPPGGGPSDPIIPPTPAGTPANEVPTHVTPEPVSVVLIGSGLAALAAFKKRRRRHAEEEHTADA